MQDRTGPRRGRPRIATDSPTTEVEVRRQRLGEALRRARGEVTQAEVARRMAVAQSTLSAWEAGKLDLTLEQLRSYEEALLLERGDLAVRSGYVDADRLWSAEWASAIGDRVYTDVNAAAASLLAGAQLGLGIRLWNRREGASDDSAPSTREIWRLIVAPAPPASHTGDAEGLR